LKKLHASHAKSKGQPRYDRRLMVRVLFYGYRVGGRVPGVGTGVCECGRVPVVGCSVPRSTRAFGGARPPFP
jgi:hypothetical protein